MANRSVFIQLVQLREKTGGEDDTKHLEQGYAKTDRSNQHQVQRQLCREPVENVSDDWTDILENIDTVPVYTSSVGNVAGMVPHTTARTDSLTAGVWHCHGRVGQVPGAGVPVRETRGTTARVLHMYI